MALLNPFASTLKFWKVFCLGEYFSKICFDRLCRQIFIFQVIISLAQRKIPLEKLHQIGFTIYETDLTGDYSADYFQSTQAIGTSGSYINYREVFGRFTLMKGSYVVIPATFLPNIEAEFLLRIFSQEKIKLEEIQN